jgi:Ca-activated chloride channel family protein
MDTIDFQFLQPLWLLLLPPGWALIWAWSRQAGRNSSWARLCDERLLAYMTAGQTSSPGYARGAWILSVVLTLGIVAAAAPSWSKQSYPLMQASDARVIVLDLSRSMLVQDVRPSRLAHALAVASEIIDSDFGGETGLVVFAGSAFVLSPLTRDAETLRAFLDAMHPDTMPQDGSNLAQAITRAQGLLAASQGDSGQILLLSSGDSHDQNEPVNKAVQAAFAAAAEGLRISVLAIGSAAGGPLLEQQGGLLRDATGRIRISRPNFDLLQRIAAAGQGSMTVVDGVGIDGDLLGSRLAASAFAMPQRGADQSSRDASDDGAWLIWWMLPLVLVLFRKNMLFVMLIALLVHGPQESYAGDRLAESQPGKAFEFWSHPEKIAIDAYRRGDYVSAYTNSENPLLRGASYYRSRQFQQALGQFSENDSAASFYNRANTLVQLERYAEALIAYQQALDLDPQLLSAAYNRRLVEIFLDQQAAAAVAADKAARTAASAEKSRDRETLATRIGSADETTRNPADEHNSGPGLGASRQTGPIDSLQRFDGTEQDEERFVTHAQGPARELEMEILEHWISSLPTTASELYRRKFLRDFQRQQQQAR